eukprot:scaffold2953_cov711-Pavlova_lutheri.AAC.1
MESVQGVRPSLQVRASGRVQVDRGACKGRLGDEASLEQAEEGGNSGLDVVWSQQRQCKSGCWRLPARLFDAKERRKCGLPLRLSVTSMEYVRVGLFVCKEAQGSLA